MKSYHDQNIKEKKFKNGDLVSMFDNGVYGMIGKLEITKHGTCIVKDINLTPLSNQGHFMDLY